MQLASSLAPAVVCVCSAGNPSIVAPEKCIVDVRLYFEIGVGLVQTFAVRNLRAVWASWVGLEAPS